MIDTHKVLQFHFAGVVSAWNRRALVGAGFGYTNSATPTDSPVDVVSVVPYRDGKSEGSEPDPEDPVVVYHRQSSLDNESEYHGPLISPDTPFFHIDLATAVFAAERNYSLSPPIVDVKTG
jgi:sodium-independent sulfate anion transporter 11